MRMYDILEKKKNGNELSQEEIAFFVKGYTEGSIPDYQASALCMAICLKGMTSKETEALTLEMAHSGDTVDLSRFGSFSVDKHSTGGVGDKTTLVVAPLVASLGMKVAKMSGRGLGHTGGTVDKLKSVPGFRTSLSEEEFLAQVEKAGVAVVGQTAALAPADKKIYALRDVTATVDSIPLIASSILSKKLAAGAHTIVLDVKVGAGAFMKTQEDAVNLAQTMVKIGTSQGRKMAALLTDMDAPLGYAVGNALEMKEAISVLRGKEKGELRILCLALATEMLSLAENIPEKEAAELVKSALDDGRAYEKMKEWIAVQGGDPAYIECPSLFPESSVIAPFYSEKEGYLCRMDAEQIGLASLLLGAGRFEKDGKIDHSAGILLKKKPGEFVKTGEVLALFHTSDRRRLKDAEKVFSSALTFGREAPPKKPLIYTVIR